MENQKLNQLEKIKKNTNDPKLKESIRKKLDILKGNKTVLK